MRVLSGLAVAVSATAAAPLFGTLMSNSANSVQEYSAGLRQVGHECFWDRVETSDGVWSETELQWKLTERDAFLKANMSLVLEPGLHEPPAYLLNLPNANFISNNNTNSSSGYNSIWSTEVRNRVERYITKLASVLDFSKYHSIRCELREWRIASSSTPALVHLGVIRHKFVRLPRGRCTCSVCFATFPDHVPIIFYGCTYLQARGRGVGGSAVPCWQPLLGLRSGSAVNMPISRLASRRHFPEREPGGRVVQLVPRLHGWGDQVEARLVQKPQFFGVVPLGGCNSCCMLSGVSVGPTPVTSCCAGADPSNWTCLLQHHCPHDDVQFMRLSSLHQIMRMLPLLLHAITCDEFSKPSVRPSHCR